MKIILRLIGFIIFICTSWAVALFNMFMLIVQGSEVEDYMEKYVDFLKKYFLHD